jgi:hypothetical protein
MRLISPPDATTAGLASGGRLPMVDSPHLYAPLSLFALFLRLR